MTTRCHPGQVRVESGVTVKLPVVWPLRTGKSRVWSTWMVEAVRRQTFGS
jgi:hypothetical protein